MEIEIIKKPFKEQFGVEFDPTNLVHRNSAISMLQKLYVDNIRRKKKLKKNIFLK